MLWSGGGDELKVGWRNFMREANRAQRNMGRRVQGYARGCEWFGMASICKLLMHNITPNHSKNDSYEMIDKNGVKRGSEGHVCRGGAW